VFIPVDEPHGLIKATLCRRKLQHSRLWEKITNPSMSWVHFFHSLNNIQQFKSIAVVTFSIFSLSFNKHSIHIVVLFLFAE
jgi:hypothetical protein